MKKYYKLLTIILLLFGCNNPVEVKTTDRIIFGFYAGFVANEIYSHIYKFENNKLFEDTKHTYVSYQREYTGNWKEMNDSFKVHINKSLLEYPSQIFTEKDTVFGMPDAYDQGGVYLQIYKPDGTTRFWLFDSQTKDIPQYMREYIENIKVIVWKIRGIQ